MRVIKDKNAEYKPFVKVINNDNNKRSIVQEEMKRIPKLHSNQT